MNLNTVFGTKIGQTQGFLENGKRVPLSCIHVEESTVTQVKKNDIDGYQAAQIAFGKRNKLSKSTAGHLKKAKLTSKKPRFFREIKVEETEGVEVGATLQLAEVLKPGDIIAVTGTSKGKGYAGVVKRHGFAGGPRTHGQSDRERAPGAIGQSATPGRVYKGKKMAGRMGNEQVTVRNLVVIDIEGDTLFVKGLIPGGKGGVIRITKIGETKNFTPLFKADEEQKDEKTEEKAEPKEASDNSDTNSSEEKSNDSDSASAKEEPKKEEKVENKSENKETKTEESENEKSEERGDKK